MEDKPEISQVSTGERATEEKKDGHHQQHHHHHHHHHEEFVVPGIEEEAVQDAFHIHLTWRSWLVVGVTVFAVVAQVFVVVAAGSVIAFIIRDLEEPDLAGWIIQAPLLMQAVLSPIVGRLSDVADRKYLAAVPPLLAFIGAVISAKATDMKQLTGGGILIGTTLSTISIVQAIPSEVLPLKYRALAQGFCGMGGTIGGLIGALGAGAVTNASPGGWRWIYWIQAIFHGITALGFFLLYWPAKSEYQSLSVSEKFWACDPVGSTVFAVGATLTMLSLDWAAGTYAWSDPHVAAPLAIGLASLVAFCVYEWKGRKDGLVAHILFRRNANFALSTFAFAVEGWIFYSAVNSYVPQIVLHMGWETTSWDISVRQLSFQCVILMAPLFLSGYATKYKDLKNPLIITFVIFLAVCIFYACLKPSFDKAQIAINVLQGFGQAGPLTLLPALVQYTAPHAHLATATGLAFSARALGGAMGSAVLDAISNGYLNGHYASAVGKAAVDAGLPESSVEALISALDLGEHSGVQGATDEIWAAAMKESKNVYAHAYRLAWSSIIPFVVVALIAVWFLKGVSDLMTEKIEATVEKNEREEKTVEP